MPCPPPAASLVLAFLLSQQPTEAPPPSPDSATRPEAAAPVEGDRLPRLLLSVAPVFPPSRSERCTVVVEFEVAEDGRVSDAWPAEETSCTTGDGIPLTAEETAAVSAPFEKESLAAVRRWVHEPALKDGKPVAATVRVQVEFDGAVARHVYAAPPETLGPKIASALEGAVEEAKPLASGDGFQIRLPKRTIEGREAPVGIALRYGEEPDGKGTWVVAAAVALIATGKERDGCECSWFLPVPGGDAAENWLAWLSLRLGMKPTATSRLVPWGSELLPSGLLESPRRDAGASSMAGVLETHDRETGLPYLEGARLSPSAARFEPPERIRKVEPVYPKRAQRARVSGRVLLEAVINERGDVGSIHVLHGNPLLAAAAVEAVCCWKYKPPKEDGKPVPLRMTIQLDFTLQGR